MYPADSRARLRDPPPFAVVQLEQKNVDGAAGTFVTAYTRATKAEPIVQEQAAVIVDNDLGVDRPQLRTAKGLGKPQPAHCLADSPRPIRSHVEPPLTQPGNPVYITQIKQT